MKKLIQMFLFFTLSNEKAFEAKSRPSGLELSDGDRAALYGWPDMTVEEAEA